MLEFLRQLLSGIVQAWKRLSVSARVNLGLAGTLTVGAIAYMVFQMSTPQYVRLYDGLDPSETAKIVDVLQQESVSYQLKDNETTIMVPAQDRSRMKIALTGKGLPTSQGTAPGFEVFKEQGIMQSRWLQDVQLMRAIQGELQRQLNEFEFVNKSFVFIREAEEELFSSKQKPSEAVVTLDVRRPLTKPEIQTVLHVISSFGGTNLSVDNITLATTDGAPLHLPATSEFASIANSKLEYIAELERQREDRVIKDFERLGIRAVVKVSADVDFDSSTETSQTSTDGAVLSTQSVTTTTTSTESLPQGAPGAMANLPEGGVKPGGTETKENTEEVTENFEPSISKKEITRSPGKVKKYVVSAIIEGKTEKSTDASGSETTQYVGLTDEQKKVYQDHIAAAVGDGETPTVVTVNDHPFDIAKLTEARTAFEAIERANLMQTVLQWGWSVLEVMLVIGGFWLARRFLRRAIITPVEEEEAEAVLQEIGPSPEDLRREEIANEVAKMSQENPDAVVALLRTWIAQDQG